MKNKVVLSLVVATLLVSPLNALNMLEKFEAMEREMKSLKAEIMLLKSNDKAVVTSKTITAPEITKEIGGLSDIDDSDAVDDIGDIDDIDDSDDSDEIGEMNFSAKNENEDKPSIEEELEEIKENLTDLNKATSGSHLKFGVDYRFAVDNLQYEMADGSKAKNDALLTNRLWINMDWAATDTVSFHGQLAYNKAFGHRVVGNSQSELENYSWVTTENAYDDQLGLRSAYFYYANKHLLGSDIGWTFSIGRRSSTNGAPINLREDDGLSSPLGHTMNVEFDGLSSKLSFNKWVPGMKVQFCAGRAVSNANTKFSSTPYAGDDSAIPNMDLGGVVLTAYDNGQYLLKSQYYYAHNLIDIKDPTDYTQGFETVGNLHSATALFKVTGIGSEISDYLDESVFFMSAAVTKTDPNEGKGMLGSSESEMGYSYWVGLQVPSLISEDGRMGVEYNYGSQYWRSITYGEDTNIGSKVATRGNAYEIYFTEYLVEDKFSLQLRYTYLDYDYAGSNGFFGNMTGSATEITNGMANAGNYVDSAQNIRLYLRYRY